MRRLVGLPLVILLSLCLAACGDDPEAQKAAEGEHLWQGQVDALEKAKGVDGMVEGAADQQRQQLEAASQ